MDYLNIYEGLISKRQKVPASGYTENHHILPKSLGGDNFKDNMVFLTGREHYIAHLLLAKIHKGTKNYYPMINAIWMMQMKCEERGIPKIKSSRMYEWVRKEHARLVSKKARVWSKGKNNSQYGTMWICNLELKENKKILKEKQIPDGWVRGRNLWKPQWKTPRSNKFEQKQNQEKNLLLDIANKHCVVRGVLIGNENFIFECLNNNISIRKILIFIGKNDSGPNYRYIKNLDAPINPPATNRKKG